MNKVNLSKIVALLPIIAALAGAIIIVMLTNKITKLQDPISLNLKTSKTALAIPSDLTSVKRIVCAGDSITKGENCSLNFVNQLSQYLNALYPGRFEVLNQGKDSDTSKGLRERFPKDVLGLKPDLVILSIGVNDISIVAEDKSKEKQMLEEYRSNLQAMIDQAKSVNARVLLVSGFLATELPDSQANNYMRLLCEELETIAKRNNLKYVRPDIAALSILRKYRETGAADLLLTIDGVHPNGQGYRVITNCILTSLGIPADTRRSVL